MNDNVRPIFPDVVTLGDQTRSTIAEIREFADELESGKRVLEKGQGVVICYYKQPGNATIRSCGDMTYRDTISLLTLTLAMEVKSVVDES